jgi:hypothetical protein
MKFVIVIEGTHEDADLNHLYKGMSEYRKRLEANGFKVKGAICSHEADYDRVVIAKVEEEEEPSPIKGMIPYDGLSN